MGPADPVDPAPDAGGGLQALKVHCPEKVDSSAVLPLRHAVLRPGRKWADAKYDLDEHDLSAHFAVRQGQTLLAVGSILPEAAPGGSGSDGGAFRVRGMAVRADLRGTGLGAKVLGALIAHAGSQGADLVWCTARVPAAGFYRSFGFVTEGSETTVRGLGPHVYMSREFSSGPSA